MDNDFGKDAAAKLKMRQNTHKVDLGMVGMKKVYDAASPGGDASKTENGFGFGNAVKTLKKATTKESC